MRRADSLEKTLMLGKRREEKGTTEDDTVGWHHNSMDMSLGKLLESVMDREVWRSAVHWAADSWR